MSVALSDQDLGMLRELLDRSIQTSFFEYERIIRGAQAKDPALVAGLVKLTTDGGWRNDGTPASELTFACSFYETAHGEATECVAALKGGGSAEAATVLRAHLASSNMWRGLGMLLLVLNGGVLSQSYINELLEQQRQADPKVKIIQEVYDELLARSGKAPSQREVAIQSQYSRETVTSRWKLLKK